MTTRLTPEGYDQTKTKLENLARRLADLESRTDLDPTHLADVRRSYKTMMRQYRREMMLYEAEQSHQAHQP
jgi:hypothetical protein